MNEIVMKKHSLIHVPQLLNGNTHTGLRVNSHMLHFENAMLSHEGQYTCVVTNSAGEDKRDFHLTIQGQCKLYTDTQFFTAVFDYLRFSCLFPQTSSVPPIFHRVINGAAGFSLGEREGDEEDLDGTEGMVERREVVLGHSISLSCESNAIPPPRLSWYRQGRQLTSSDGVVLLPGEWSETFLLYKESVYKVLFNSYSMF